MLDRIGVALGGGLGPADSAEGRNNLARRAFWRGTFRPPFARSCRLRSPWCALRDATRGLALENAALRQQSRAYLRTEKRPRLSHSDRLIRIILRWA